MYRVRLETPLRGVCRKQVRFSVGVHELHVAVRKVVGSGPFDLILYVCVTEFNRKFTNTFSKEM